MIPPQSALTGVHDCADTQGDAARFAPNAVYIEALLAVRRALVLVGGAIMGGGLAVYASAFLVRVLVGHRFPLWDALNVAVMPTILLVFAARGVLRLVVGRISVARRDLTSAPPVVALSPMIGCLAVIEDGRVVAGARYALRTLLPKALPGDYTRVPYRVRRHLYDLLTPICAEGDRELVLAVLETISRSQDRAAFRAVMKLHTQLSADSGMEDIAAAAYWCAQSLWPSERLEGMDRSRAGLA